MKRNTFQKKIVLTDVVYAIQILNIDDIVINVKEKWLRIA